MQGPYRPNPQQPPPDPELARLAMEIAAGREVEQRASGGQHLRTAIGAYRGSTIKRVVLFALIGGVLCGVTGVTLASLGQAEIGLQTNGLDLDGVARTATFMADWNGGAFGGGATLRVDSAPAR